MEQILLDQEHFCQDLLGVGLLLGSKTACHSNQIVTGLAHSVSDVLFCFWLRSKVSTLLIIQWFFTFIWVEANQLGS